MAQLGEVVFALERFELSAEERLEVVGRWEGLEGRRMGRPVLTVVESDGRRRRLTALPGGQLSSTHAWRAAFAWDGDVASIDRAELELGRRLVVELPAPRRRRRRSVVADRALQATEAVASIEASPVVTPAPSNGGAPAAPDTGGVELEARVAALEEELAAARADADDLRERLETARDGIVERDRRLMALQEAADRAADDATRRLDAERAEAAEVRTSLAEAREAAELARTEATQAIATEAEETERMREELQAARRQAEETVAAERAETARLREELAERPAASEAPTEEDAPGRRMLDKVTRDLERERATNRTLRRDLEALQGEAAELRRSAAVTAATAEQPQPALRRPVAAHRVDVARAAGAHLVPDHHPSPARLWATRAAAGLLVGLLALALALIVVPLR
jgi:hypothetical protein